MDANTMRLSEIPEIKELMQVLSDNGLQKEKSNVKHLVAYIEDMENKLTDMSAELKTMHGEVGKIRDSTLRARCTQLVTAAKLTDMEHSAEEKAKNLRETYEERKSVKTDLKKLKAEQAKAKNAPTVAEPSR